MIFPWPPSYLSDFISFYFILVWLHFGLWMTSFEVIVVYSLVLISLGLVFLISQIVMLPEPSHMASILPLFCSPYFSTWENYWFNRFWCFVMIWVSVVLYNRSRVPTCFTCLLICRHVRRDTHLHSYTQIVSVSAAFGFVSKGTICRTVPSVPRVSRVRSH